MKAQQEDYREITIRFHVISWSLFGSELPNSKAQMAVMMEHHFKAEEGSSQSTLQASQEVLFPVISALGN